LRACHIASALSREAITRLDDDLFEAALVTRFSRWKLDMMDNSRQCGLLLLILACAIGAARVEAQAPPLRYADDFAALGKLAAANNSPIMLVFTRPGCPFCARAKKDHLEPLSTSPGYGAQVMLREIESTNDLIPLRDFDGTLTTHGDFARKYSVHTVPTVIVVDARGLPLADPLVGLNAPDFYNLYLEQAIDAARLQLRAR
jgi:thioredoxin-related protein